MTCPYCQNSDPDLLEMDSGAAVYCTVCSRIASFVRCGGPAAPTGRTGRGPSPSETDPGSHVSEARKERPMRRLCGVFVVLLLWAVPLSAQTVINPRYVEFLASADHTVVLPDGAPMVTSYEVRWFLDGAAAPFQKVSLGKPTPDGTGLIRLSLVDPTDLLVGVPVDPRSTYFARVAAIGPTGEGESGNSNFFVRASGPKSPTQPRVSK